MKTDQTLISTIKQDARVLQIAILLALLSYGLTALDFPIQLSDTLIILASTCTTQVLFLILQKKWDNTPAQYLSLMSPLISGLSLCILFRFQSPIWAVAAGFLAIASKYIIHFQQKHIFNPTNFAIVCLILLVPNQTWVSPGQWTSGAYLAFLMSSIGVLVISKSQTSVLTLSFVLFYAALEIIRALILEDPLTIPLHSLLNGSFLIFAFFMISDPKSTPNHKTGQLIFAASVALSSFWIKHQHFYPNALFLALFFVAPLTPFLDKIFKAKKFQFIQTDS